ncbi:hypothetical protein A0J61_07460 [Choanephora cucurbitarum]|uniref:Extracellular membrane protein CFEM domain-containing protein n=1 Tax=Choanephora cucurbitarum TaxID=101091 RepID=A0A1C7N654_9FUNG|nr:hypothetical protein A0J61_07460 [Choanephora cucurbitarum]
MYTVWIISFVVAVVAVFSVHAADCAAEANFQGCKSIQETALKTCGPVDYACQCKAQNLIRQCYDLCPTYAAEASVQSGVAAGICAAVPATSSSLLPSASTSASVQSSSALLSPTVQRTASASAPSSSTTNSSSFAYRMTPFVPYALLITFLTISVVHLV